MLRQARRIRSHFLNLKCECEEKFENLCNHYYQNESCQAECWTENHWHRRFQTHPLWFMLLAHCSFTDKLSVLSEPRHAKGSVVTTILKVLCIYQVYLAFFGTIIWHFLRVDLSCFAYEYLATLYKYSSSTTTPASSGFHFMYSAEFVDDPWCATAHNRMAGNCTV